MSRRANYPPTKLLLIMRNHTANDWESLCKEFHLDPLQFDTGHAVLARILYELRDAGLASFSGDPGSNGAIEGKIEISPSWEKIQMALDISLKELTELKSADRMKVQPLFGLPSEPLTEYDLFVLMPFTEDLKPVYQDHIVKVSQSLNLHISRADDIFTTHAIMSDIWDAICATRLIIADCTYRNPNVFYEIGLAHTVGKKVILITQSKDDVPFDLRHLRFIEYKYTPRGMTEFERSLTETIKMELSLLD